MISDNKELRIAVPSKGRLKEKAVSLLEKAGIKISESGRQLFATCKETGILVIFSNTKDIPVLVAEGVVDVGITGSDCVIEKSVEVIELLKLGFGKCRLSFASHKDSDIINAPDLSGKTVGTSFPVIAGQFCKDQGISDVRFVEIGGAVEVMVLLHLVDAVFDVVETGSSLRAHDLVERATALKSEAVLIGNDSPRNSELRDRLIRRIEGVLLAGRYSMLEYNCPADRLKEATLITPGYSSPTLQKTESDDWVSVKVMVEKKKVQSVMDELEAIGCHAIMETEVIHCRL